MKARTLHVGFVSLALTFMTAPTAFASARSCEELFAARIPTVFAASKAKFMQEIVRDLRDSEAYARKMKRVTPAGSVTRGEITQGSFGGIQILATRKENLPWPNSYARLMYGKKSLDAQGDARSPIIVLGFDLADVFGVHFVNESQLRLDDPKEADGRIDAFNVFLEKRGVAPIAVRFYVVPKHVKGATAVLEFYLKEFATHGALPVKDPQDEWVHFLHDVSFHRHFAAIHPDVLAKVKTFARSKYDFWKFAERYFDKNLKPEMAVIAKRALLFKLSDELDFANALFMQGNLFLISSAESIGSSADMERELYGYASQLVESFGFPRSPLDQLSSTVDGLQYIAEHGADATDEAFLFGSHRLSSQFPSSIWRKALDEFARTSPDRDLKKNLIANESELESLALKQVVRRKKLIEAAAAYRQSQPLP